MRPLIIDSPVYAGVLGGGPAEPAHPSMAEPQRGRSGAAAGRCAAPPLVPDNKEIVQLKAFPAAVPGDGPYNSRACIVCLDSMWDGEIGCVIVP